jgi:tyrosyl-tRNA synthetase
MHIGMGLVCGGKIRDMVDASFDFTIFLADWHSMINNKFGGDLEKIRTAGEYFKHCFTALGLSEDRVRYVWASELAGRSGYWERVLRVGKTTTAQRVMRALPIMGKEMKGQDTEAASLFYPCMQAADIFEMELDVACAGIDQRKAHVLARETGEKLGWGKPVCLHVPILAGLAGFDGAAGSFDEDPKLSRVIAAKMSKSKPASSILVHDEPSVIGDKLRKAFCPPGVVEGNPVLEYFRVLVFADDRGFLFKRDAKYGGDMTVKSYDELERLYVGGKIHPQDLKANIGRFLSERLLPVREYFARRPEIIDGMRRLEAERE